MLEPVKEQFPRLKRVWGDSHYGGTLLAWAKEHLEWDIEIVRGLVTVKGSASTDQELTKPGFQVLPRRWVVERSIAWITRWRRLTRDHEGLPESSETFIQISASRRMLSLLAPPFP